MRQESGVAKKSCSAKDARALKFQANNNGLEASPCRHWQQHCRHRPCLLAVVPQQGNICACM
eukprot:156471-Pelagomonas_calceolata.AAC.1